MNLQEVDPEHGVDLLVRIGLHRIDAADFEERWLRFGCVNLPFAKHRGRAGSTYVLGKEILRADTTRKEETLINIKS